MPPFEPVPGQVADPRPVVLVTQGIAATDPTDLLLPALDALRHEPVQVVPPAGERQRRHRGGGIGVESCPAVR
jgi:hypothetical protein